MRLQVCVVLALPDRQEVVEVEVADGATISEAVAASGLAARFPDIDVERLPVGIWSRPRPRDAAVRQGDRIELYRPLQADAKAERRARARLRPSSTRSRSGR